ncbi:hypothetical protein HMPREF0043_02354, partial [Actinobaculum sp. oral taxon 183 str. F0552]
MSEISPTACQRRARRGRARSEGSACRPGGVARFRGGPACRGACDGR